MWCGVVSVVWCGVVWCGECGECGVVWWCGTYLIGGRRPVHSQHSILHVLAVHAQGETCAGEQAGEARGRGTMKSHFTVPQPLAKSAESAGKLFGVCMPREKRSGVHVRDEQIRSLLSGTQIWGRGGLTVWFACGDVIWEPLHAQPATQTPSHTVVQTADGWPIQNHPCSYAPRASICPATYADRSRGQDLSHALKLCHL
jgi:hypothetical protein